MKDTIKWSHSKLSTILTCPMSYYLNYVQGISPKKTKPAFEIGSAVHWGIEHNTYDLRQYYIDEELLGEDFTQEQLLAQAMDYFYLCYKDYLYKQILVDPTTQVELKLLEERHEGFITAHLPSFLPEMEAHNFLGIVDLLFKTDKGFVIIDFKTSSCEPDWNNYLDQLYRYVYLVKAKYPEIPIVKIGIINIRKAQLYKRKDVSSQDYFNMLCQEYFNNPTRYIDYHEFPASTIKQDFMDDYIKNLSRMVDTAYTIDKNQAWYINFAEAEGKYGKSDYYDIFYKTKNAYTKYKIKDKVWSEEKQAFVKTRSCVPIDMNVVEHSNVLNHYSDYKALKEEHKEDFDSFIRTNYIVDENLLYTYQLTEQKLLEQKEI